MVRVARGGDLPGKAEEAKPSTLVASETTRTQAERVKKKKNKETADHFL